MDVHLTTTDLLAESDTDIRLVNESRNNESYYNQPNDKMVNNSYYNVTSNKQLVIPTSCQSRYNTIFENGSKVSNKKSGQKQHTSSLVRSPQKNQESNSPKKSKHWTKQKKAKDLSKILSEKVLEGTRFSTRNNTKIKGFDHFGGTMTKLDKYNTKRSRMPKMGLYSTNAVNNRLSTEVLDWKKMQPQDFMQTTSKALTSGKFWVKTLTLIY